MGVRRVSHSRKAECGLDETQQGKCKQNMTLASADGPKRESNRDLSNFYIFHEWRSSSVAGRWIDKYMYLGNVIWAVSDR